MKQIEYLKEFDRIRWFEKNCQFLIYNWNRKKKDGRDVSRETQINIVRNAAKKEDGVNAINIREMADRCDEYIVELIYKAFPILDEE